MSPSPVRGGLACSPSICPQKTLSINTVHIPATKGRCHISTNRWLGAAAAIAQVQAATITGYDVTTTYTVTINAKIIASLGTGGTVTTTAAALVVLLNASTEPEFAEVTWSNSSGTIIGTADTAGKPFIFTLTVAGGTGTVGAVSSTTANSGPNDINLAANWSDGIPTAADALYIDSTDVSLLYNLQSLSAVAVTSIDIGQNFTGSIGLPKVNADSSTDYHEYRADYWQIQATTVNIGYGTGDGSGLIKLDVGSATATTFNVNNSGSATEAGLEAIQLKGTNAANVLNVNKGSVAVAAFPGELATVATLRVGYETSQSSDAAVRCTVGVTLTTINQSGGTLSINGAATTINQTGGILTVDGTGAVTTITLDGASMVYNSSGTITTLTVGVDSTADFAQDMRPKTITNEVNLYGGATLNDPFGILTLTAGFQTQRCRLSQVAIDLGVNRSYTVA